MTPHPSLLPAHKGLHTHDRAIEAGDSHGGCTVHLVTAELDDGPVLGQTPVAKSVPVDDEYKYQRIYPAPYQYAPVTGWFSYFSSAGIERTQNDVLSGEDSRLFVTKLVDLIGNKQPQGGNVLLTLDPKAQQAAYDGLAALGPLTQGADTDGAVFADLVHGIGDDVADLGVPVGGDGRDLADFLAVGDLLGNARELGDGGLNGLVDTALEVNRVGTGGDVLETFAIDALGEDGRGGGAVAGSIGGLGSDFLHHLRAHVLVGIGQLDFLGDGHAVLGDGRGAEFLVDDDIAALGPEGDFDGAGEQLDAAEDFLTSGLVEEDLFSRHVLEN